MSALQPGSAPLDLSAWSRDVRAACAVLEKAIPSMSSQTALALRTCMKGALDMLHEVRRLHAETQAKTDELRRLLAEGPTTISPSRNFRRPL